MRLRLLALLALAVGVNVAASLDALLQQGRTVPELFATYGFSTAAIAAAVGYTARHVRRLVAGTRPPKKPVPSKRILYLILLREVARHGGEYGWGFLRGVLRAYHPQYRFPQRRVMAALRRLFPHAHRSRCQYTAQRLERGRYIAPN